MAAASPLRLRIEGMDCGACAVKIENAMRRLPGVAHIEASYGQGSLSLTFDEDRISRDMIEAKIKALGYTSVASRKAGSNLREQDAAEGDRQSKRLNTSNKSASRMQSYAYT